MIHRFGAFAFDDSQRQLLRDGVAVPLAPKAADTLQALLDNRGRVVSKAELMKLVWPDCTVEEIGLARNVSILRKALGDDSEQFIQTVPKRGYRFAAEEPESVAEPVAAAVPRKPSLLAVLALPLSILILAAIVYWQFYRPSRFVERYGATLVVVPVEALSPELERSPFPASLADALVEEIAKLKVAQVVSPSTVQRYRRWRVPVALMTRVLGTDVVLEGSAQAFGSDVRVSTRLSDVHSGRLIWADRYDIPASDLKDGQTRVAQAIAAKVGQRLGRDLVRTKN